MKKNSLSLFILTVLAFVASAQAQTYSYRIVNFPGVAESSLDSLNNSGAIVGSFTQIDYPSSSQTVVLGLNNSDEMSGSYADASGTYHGSCWRAAAIHRWIFPERFLPLPKA